MIKFKHEEQQLGKAFNISLEDIGKITELLNQEWNGKNKPVSWMVQRVWIDETLTDNARCFMVFNLGRHYEMDQKGGEQNHGGM